MATEALRDDVIASIHDLLEQEMRPFGLSSIDVAPGTDFDGDPAIRVEVRYGADGAPIDPGVMARLVSKLRNRLWAQGEERFPYIRHHYPDDRPVVGAR